MRDIFNISVIFALLMSSVETRAAESLPQPTVAPVEIPVAQLDAMLAKERLRRIYADFNLKLAGDWLVTVDDRTEKWKWNTDKQTWSCPPAQKERCTELIPQSFKWWGRGKAWIQDWNPVSREGLEFGRVRVESEQSKVGTEEASGDPTTEEVKAFEGKKTADEVWIWKSSNGAEAKFYISLRDQKIERIESGDGVERFEWFQKQPGSMPELNKLYVERGGTFMTLTRIR